VPPDSNPALRQKTKHYQPVAALSDRRVIDITVGMSAAD